MSQAALLVVAVGVVTIALKASGPLLLGTRVVPPLAGRVMALLGPALLAALVATNAFASGRHLSLDARAAGLVVAAGCIALRAPLLVTVVAAAAVTAGIRALTG